ncbi:hypothetical protein GY45DRAFT_1307885 [Cubamyces sp. BRFM 1775]|nr:hypothetical protein GY45DRAFT_1307885 [Cubamyces sp. BRFM 1775]
MPDSPYMLRVLNFDILSEIIELLHEVKLLAPFSETCKMLRRASKPHLFRKVRILASSHLLRGELFSFTTDIWLYVRYLTIRGYWYGEPLDLSDLPLADFLARMPSLQTITVDEAAHMGGPGIPWDGIAALLSPPQVREFNLKLTLHEGTPTPLDDTFTIAPLTKFSFSIWDYVEHPRAITEEISLTEHVLKAVALSLEYLSIPLDVAPFAVMVASCWSHLRVLQLKGDLDHDPVPGIIDVLSCMPHLRHLTILRARRDDTPRPILWPDARTNGFPCPHLATLCLSHLDPTDAFYTHLPPTLRQLSLRCWPHHYLHQHRHDLKAMARLGWQSQLCTAADLRSVLRRCSFDSLEDLEIEYEEDEHEERLLRSIPELFPHLTYLTIYRYRKAGSSSVRVADIAQALSPLRMLRMLRIHLDLAEAPHPLADYMLDSPPFIFDTYEQALCEIAHTLAVGLGPNLQLICLFLRKRWSNLWIPFRVTRDLARSVSEIKRETDLIAVGGHALYDDMSPNTVEQVPLPEELDLFEF